MRNILVYADGTEVHFQYPKDHKIGVGYPFTFTLLNDEKLTKKVVRIETHETEPEIRYFLEA